MLAKTENRKARFNYEVLETFQSGIELTGHETKSLKKNGGSLEGAHAIIRNGEMYVVGLEIPSFQPKNAPPGYDVARVRRLLLKKEEIQYLLGKTRSGLTLIPLKTYYNPRGLVKIELAVARGRKTHDKRELLKKRDAVREARKATLSRT